MLTGVCRRRSAAARDHSCPHLLLLALLAPCICGQPNNLEARKEMQLASFEAGVAFTRTSVGYIHAVAHTFGGMFHVPHGWFSRCALTTHVAFNLEPIALTVFALVCRMSSAAHIS